MPETPASTVEFETAVSPRASELRTLFDHVIGSTVIDFRVGGPGADLLDRGREAIADAAGAAMRGPDGVGALQYGPLQGDGVFLTHLSQWLTKEYAEEVPVEHLVVSTGCTGGLTEALTLFTHRDTIVFAEDPTYFLALLVFADHALRTESVATDDAGFVLADFEHKLEKARKELDARGPGSGWNGPEKEYRYDFVLYLCPTYSNPSGITLTPTQRENLVKLARKYDVLIISDDVYQTLPHTPTSRPPPRLLSYDLSLPNPSPHTPGTVISLQSFSKILGPGLRMGWIESSKEIVDRIAASGINESGGAPQHFTAHIVTHLLRTGQLEPHLLWTREKLRSRTQAMLEGLAWLSEPWAVERGFRLLTNPTGGYFAWLVGPPTFSASKLWTWLKSMRKQYTLASSPSPSAVPGGSTASPLDVTDLYVSFAPGNTFSVSKTKDNCARLCFAYYEEDKLKEGGERLGRVVRRWCEMEGI
ncbi:PLP-dependent transferase [Gonapodya prolifera JEL478]|uniref:PLP-dependent transferase n=1 Tax=Gonapodya prolifera (strain JEL478) TaxID=1344416 RepID=A0A139AL63_GONPJ|nr:PLP-dependent transferase [Gonapodya prolifera JEL478]|eukprot:KXS17155.1 PLP-dependent transferase [Gonapodya prolifera JEL478]